MKKTIVVVDDDKSILKVLSAILEDEHYDVCTFDDAKNVLDIIPDKIKPDLMFIDVHMDAMDGSKLCRHLKKIKSMKHVPIILMTAGIHIEDKTEEAHADGYIHKPFGISDFLKTISTHLSDSSLEPVAELQDDSLSLTNAVI